MEKIRITEKTGLIDGKLFNTAGVVLQAEAENYFLLNSRIIQLHKVN